MSAGIVGRAVVRRAVRRIALGEARFIASNAGQAAQAGRDSRLLANGLVNLTRTPRVENLGHISDMLTTMAEHANIAGRLASSPSVSRAAREAARAAEVASEAIKRLSGMQLSVLENNMPHIKYLVEAAIKKADILAERASAVARTTADKFTRATLAEEKAAKLTTDRENKRLAAAVQREVKATERVKVVVTPVEREAAKRAAHEAKRLAALAEREAAKAERIVEAARREMQRRTTSALSADRVATAAERAAASSPDVARSEAAVALRNEANHLANEVSIAEANLATAVSMATPKRATANELAKLAAGTAGLGIVAVAEEASAAEEYVSIKQAEYRAADAEARKADERLIKARNDLKGYYDITKLDKVIALADAEKAAEAAHEKFYLEKAIYTEARVEATHEKTVTDPGLTATDIAIEVAMFVPIPGYAEAETAIIDPLMDNVVLPLAEAVTPGAHLINRHLAEAQKAQQVQEEQETRLADWQTVNELQDGDNLDQALSERNVPFDGRIIPYEKSSEQTLSRPVLAVKSSPKNAEVWAKAAQENYTPDTSQLSENNVCKSEETNMSLDPNLQPMPTSRLF